MRNDVLNPWFGRVADLFNGEVDARREQSTVNPLFAGMPAFHCWWIEELLPHQTCGTGVLSHAGLRAMMRAYQFQDTRDEFRGTLDFGEARRLEKVGVEKHTQHVRNLATGFGIGVCEHLNRLRILRWCNVPRWHLRFVCDEEVVEVPGDESGTSRLLHDDVNNVIAVEVPGVS